MTKKHAEINNAVADAWKFVVDFGITELIADGIHELCGIEIDTSNVEGSLDGIDEDILLLISNYLLDNCVSRNEVSACMFQADE